MEPPPNNVRIIALILLVALLVLLCLLFGAPLDTAVSVLGPILSAFCC